MGKPLVDRTGLQYGRLTVVSRGENYRGNAMWVCKCSCGSRREVVALGNDLQRGKVKSCGCWNAERIVKHGRSRSAEYNVWKQMLQRCDNPKSPAFEHYGGRGISVCPEWRDFNRFIADMGFRPKGYTLDRIDNNGNYEPDNCRWATTQEQLNNQRRNRVVELSGRKQTVAQWATELGISFRTLWGRIDTYGWPIERALTEPVQPGRHLKSRNQRGPA